MKWRDWQLIIILVLLLYIAGAITLGILERIPAIAEVSPPLPPPTLRPTMASSTTAPTTSVPSPTTTSTATETPAPTDTLEATLPATPVPSSTPTALPEPSATPTLGTLSHKVQAGENLTGIAQRYGVTIRAIIRANGLSNPDVIYIGQELVIPLPAPATSATPSG